MTAPCPINDRALVEFAERNDAYHRWRARREGARWQVEIKLWRGDKVAWFSSDGIGRTPQQHFDDVYSIVTAEWHKKPSHEAIVALER
ncbi:MAG: hypothetical protein U5M50_03865 [Sphingobium sp.]|nr:hypothetical protein [Sphingobium sp.]